MATKLLERVEEQLRRLPPHKLLTVAEFIEFVASREGSSEADFAMWMSQDALARLWDRPEEDEAWADL